MDALSAISWVDENREIIQRWIHKKLMFTPYDMEDYLGDAYKAALIAANKIAASKAGEEPVFHKVFWQIFKEEVAVVTPCPIDDEKVLETVFEKALADGLEEAEAKQKAENRLATMKNTERCTRSVSLPNSYFVTSYNPEVDLIDDYSRYKEKIQFDFDIDATVNAASGHLKGVEVEVLVMTLGATREGSLSQTEIAQRTGLHYRSIRRAQGRIFNKLNEAKESGLFDPKDFVSWRDPFESELRLAS